jgi:hypothetical protein
MDEHKKSARAEAYREIIELLSRMEAEASMPKEEEPEPEAAPEAPPEDDGELLRALEG